jgi:hypothetical protein
MAAGFIQTPAAQQVFTLGQRYLTDATGGFQDQ